MTKLYVDLSSILWTCLRVKGDTEQRIVNFAGKEIRINTAEHGYENAVNSINGAMHAGGMVPMDIVLVEEGMFSKRRRLLIDQKYKSKRPDKAPEEYEEFQKLRDMVVTAYQSVGACRVTQDNVEGDDVVGYLARNSEEDAVVHSNDGDLLVLAGVNKYGKTIKVWQGGEEARNKYGEFPGHLITTYKALVGDTNDTVGGCPGFGAGKFMDFVAKYGLDGLEELQGVLESGSLRALDSLPQCKLLKMLLDNEARVLQCYELVKIHDEWINTRMQPLQWFPGMVTNTCKDERLAQYRATRRLVTTDNLQEVYKFLLSKLKETPWFPFDVETSSLPEADEWLEAQGRPDGVDSLGSTLTGFSLTFGCNLQHTCYFSIDHRDTKNIALDDARAVLEAVFSTKKEIVIQNTAFESAILALTEDGGVTWKERWKDNGYEGFIPNWLDTAFEAMYVDENRKRGLKERSKHHLGYDQTSYETTTTKIGKEADLPKGGRVKGYTQVQIGTEDTGEVDVVGAPIYKPLFEEHCIKQYKMKELTGLEVLNYGCDDTVCTAALHNFYKLHMQLEHHYQVYLDVEIGASYLHAQSYLDGKVFSLEEMRNQEKTDDATYEAAWVTVRNYLISKGWAGTVPPVYSSDLTPKQIKEAYSIYMGLGAVEEPDEDAEAPVEEVKDPVMSSRVRTPSKLAELVKAQDGAELLGEAIKEALKSEDGAKQLTELVQARFTGEPAFKTTSPKQMVNLLYTVMGFECRVFNKPTPKMRKEGRRVGNPRGDAVAIKFALLEADEERKAVLEGLQLLQMVQTRRGLYYSSYPYFIHWRTGKVHSQHLQCSTSTRRAASMLPNDQQLPKHPKVEGQEARFRACIKPHAPGCVIVSLDESQQELRLMAECSQDPNLLSCYTGPLKDERDVHSLTGLKILAKRNPEAGELEYAEFRRQLKTDGLQWHAEAKISRYKAKPVNFGDQYGAMALKLSELLVSSEEEAQTYLDAKNEAFPLVNPWKKQYIQECKETGTAKTLLGAVRHLAEAFNSDDFSTAGKAERQAVSLRIQGSGAEMLKLVESRLWKERTLQKHGVVYYGPIHDECVFSVPLTSLFAFLQDAHSKMVQPYAGIKVNIVSEASFGPDFHAQIELGPVITEEVVAKGMKEYEELVAA